MYEFHVPVTGESGGNWPHPASRFKIYHQTGEASQTVIPGCPETDGGETVCATAERAAFIEAAGRLVCLSVSALYGIELRDLICRTRGKANASRARQVAMYVMHKSLSMTYQEVADFFHRDRTTVSHACALIEDARDRQVTDAEISVLERLVEAARGLASCEGETR